MGCRMRTQFSGTRSFRRQLRPVGRGAAAGQAMVLGLVLILVLCVGVVVLFDTGQVVNKKVQLTNASDAAAYSVAAQQARALNFAAYMNRGRVANEVTIAQTISVYSWMNQMHTTSITMRTAMDVLSAIPYVGVVFKALGAVFKVAEKVFKASRKAFNPVAQASVRALDGLNGAYAMAATSVIEGVARVDGYKTANDVVKANVADAEIGVVGTGVLTAQLFAAESKYLDTFQIPRSGSGGPPTGSTKQRAGADRYRNVVMQSRDDFSRDREETVDLWLIKFTAAGGTDQVEYSRWAAVDTMGLEVNLPWPLDDIDMPLGWGGAQAVPSYRNQRFMSGFANGRGWYSEYDGTRKRPYGNSERINRWPSRMVDGDANVALDGGQHKKAYFTGYSGLDQYHDVKKGKATDPDGGENAGPIFTVYADTAIANARTSSSTGIGAPAGSRMALQDKAQNNKLAALSSAQVYFNRPPNYDLFRRKKDGKLETGNLFSPYWQARLVDTPTATKTALLAAGAAGFN